MNIEIKIENGILTNIEPNHPTHYFKIADKMPKGYGVWPIGEHMGTDEYIPCCEPLSVEQPNHINSDTLIAIKLPPEEVLILRRVASYYGGTVDELKQALKRKKLYLKRGLLKQAIEILQRIQGD